MVVSKKIQTKIFTPSAFTSIKESKLIFSISWTKNGGIIPTQWIFIYAKNKTSLKY